jgi:VWFA-related protein
MTTPYLLPLVFFSLSVGAAQQNVAPNRITLDIVANDKSGKPVTGLQQQDFAVLDNKQPQKILSFEAKDAREPIEIVLVTDSVNASFSRVAFERDQLKKFLQQDDGSLVHPTSIALFSDAGMKLLEEPSRDGKALLTDLDNNEHGLRDIRRSQGFYGAAQRTDLSLRALDQLARIEATRPGRKIVVWISPGWPLLSGPRMELTPKAQADTFKNIVVLSTLLRESRVTLYSANPLGSDESLSRNFYYQEFLKGVQTEKQAQFGNLALQVLATQSGGRVFNSNNDVTNEIETSIRDADAYYVISFDAIPADGPNDYHALEVKLAHHDLKAQTRAGYYAQPPQSHTP